MVARDQRQSLSETLADLVEGVIIIASVFGIAFAAVLFFGPTP